MSTKEQSSSNDQFSQSHNPADKKGPTFNPTEAAKASHPVTVDNDKLRASGKETGMVKPPIVSVNPTSKQAGDDKEVDFQKVSEASNVIIESPDKSLNSKYPFDDLSFGDGLFIPIPKGKTTDEIIEKMYKEVHAANEFYSEDARNENGDTILDQTVVEERKRNDDGTVQLENDKPIVGANQTQAKKKIQIRQYVVRPVVKDNEIGKNKKADSDGVLIIRVF